jgi:transcriptional regulator with XRE-family HTH domain
LVITLKAARVNKGYTQKEVAKLIGVSKETLSNYERGLTHPNISIVKKIEKLYDVSYDEFIFLNIKSALRG